MSELESIEHYTGIIRGRLVDIERKASDQQEKVKKLQAERDQLKAERDGLNRDQTQLAARVDELRAQLADQNSVPRVITAEELRYGMWVAFTPTLGPGWDSGPVEEGPFDDRLVGWKSNIAANNAHTIVLLEDAPGEEPEPVKVGDKISTVEELDGLADGSVVLDYVDDAHQKADGVWWEAARREERDAAGMLTYAPFTVLYLPEETA